MKIATKKSNKLFQAEQGGGIALFKREIFERPFCICDVIKRCLCKRSVAHLSMAYFLMLSYPILSYDGRE